SPSAGWNPLVSDRVAAGLLMLMVHRSIRSSRPAALARAVTRLRARASCLPAWLAEVSTRISTSRGRGAAAGRVGLTCQAKTVSPVPSLYARAGTSVYLVLA